MRWRNLSAFDGRRQLTLLMIVLFVVLQSHFSACYKSEVAITPSPLDEPTTKKSGFFSGIRNYFSGKSTTTTSTTTTTTTPSSIRAGVQKPPPLAINQQAPLMPLGPRPDTPPSSPAAGASQRPPNWPDATNNGGTAVATGSSNRPSVPQYPQPGQSGQPVRNNPSSTYGSINQQRPGLQPNLPPGHTPYYSTRPGQPSGVDLSYGGIGGTGGRPGGGRPVSGGVIGGGLAPLTSSTTTTTTTPKTVKPGAIKEDFPPLPAPKSANSPSPDAGARPPSPSVWSTPRTPGPALSGPKPGVPVSGPSAPSIPTKSGTPSPIPAGPKPSLPVPAPSSPSSGPPKSVPNGSNVPSTSTTAPSRVAFVPHSPDGSTTTARPGSAQALATDAEIRTLTETLYTKEVNSQLGLIRVQLQGKTRSIDSTDEAPQPLLEVDPRALEVPTIAKMRLLFNNYEMDTMTNEHVTPNERLEENDFLDAVMATSVMRQAMLFLQNKGIVSPDPKVHRDLVKELWFTQYSRGKGKIGSSGFEHVFVNEVLNTTIIGLHNWVYFHEEEKAGRLDYKGYLKELDLGTKAKVIKMRFTHNNRNKPVNSLFVGTSPELELALYTVCFKLRPDSTCPVSLGNSQFGVITYSWRYRGKSLIGSAFPEI